MQNAQIKIERLDVKGNYPTKTDKKGHYFYGGCRSAFIRSRFSWMARIEISATTFARK
jgi:hypothetical protein